ncbi:MAG TPA: type II secretion system secretin GspD [Allosphingosinicella sp.]
MRHTPLGFVPAAAALSLAAAGLILPALTGLSSRAEAAQKKRATEEGYTLAFVEADVRRVVDAVLGEMMSLDYSVDPKVQGNITLRTRQPVPRSQLLSLLENALRSVDAVIIVDGVRYRVVSRENARSRAPVTGGGTGGAPLPGSGAAGYASEAVPLRNAGAKEIARLLEQFLGKDVVAGADEARNQIVIVGTGEERQAARTLIVRFDVDALSNMNFELIRLESVDADTVAAELERVFQPPFDIIGTRVRLVPLPRLRSLLLVAAERADIDRVEPWVRRLDAGGSGKRKLYSYAVQNGRARDIAASLQLVLGMAAPAADPGGRNQRAAPNVVRDAEAAPDEVIAPQTPIPGNESPVFGAAAAGPRIVPNEENNSLLLYATGEEYEFIREALDKLDQPVAQVLIEATLAEVTLTNDLRYGINFRALSGDASVANSGTGSGVPASIFPGFSVSLLGSTAQAVLNTLQSKTNVRVLSAPKLMVLNNQTATLQVGDQVPIITQQAQSVSAAGAPIVNTVELRDTGVILKVTPRVNDSGTIILDIAQEVSDVSQTTSSGINSPTIQQRRIASTVATRSGQMIALGGLIRDSVTKTKSGIPLLSQIPIIGGAFGSHGNIGTRTELIILITPTVVRSPGEVGEVVDALIEGLDRTRPLVEKARREQVGGNLPKQR